jgi:hypothetical protein
LIKLNSDKDDPLGAAACEEALKEATTEAITEREKFLKWISGTDEFKPIGIFDPSPSQFQNVAWNAIDKIDPASPNATDELDKFIREADWIDRYGLGRLRSKLRSFKACCDAVKFRREIWLSAVRFRK